MNLIQSLEQSAKRKKEITNTTTRKQPEPTGNAFVDGAVKGSLYDTYTENGMKAMPSTGSALVNLFFSISSLRGKDVIPAFEPAFNENPLLAMKLALYIRDIRGGQGERQAFRDILYWLTNGYPYGKTDTVSQEHTLNLIAKVPQLGRWDDLFYVDSSYQPVVFNMISEALKYADTQGLCAKWLPRQGVVANALRKYLGFSSPKAYRKHIVELSKTVEQAMCANKWQDIQYSAVPSLAFKKYSRAFVRHDNERFNEFVNEANEGKQKVNAGAIYPYQVYWRAEYTNNKAEIATAQAQWNNLPDCLPKDSQILVMCDDSGSMNCYFATGTITPLLVARSLAVYTSERLKSAFKDLFMTFSQTPRWMNLKKFNSLKDKADYVREHCEVANTDIEAAFNLIFETATANNVSPEDMPKTLLILSDMQFDEGVKFNAPAIELVKRQYKQAGYEVPQIVFWNLAPNTNNFPVSYNENGVCLISGFSPNILKYLGTPNLTPERLMLDVLENKRYEI